ncbi:hypothetical protein Tharo_0545 [Thauera aromatica K172]|uniref:Uncharacterized protein n=1 Tax=Thauera aromatica K172 TaxID=44139 RepID=A0A2R4BJK2_THAAR|nr:hypothetical protein Tharo_0545 [Thauera aromatica K172]
MREKFHPGYENTVKKPCNCKDLGSMFALYQCLPNFIFLESRLRQNATGQFATGTLRGQFGARGAKTAVPLGETPITRRTRERSNHE